MCVRHIAAALFLLILLSSGCGTRKVAKETSRKVAKETSRTPPETNAAPPASGSPVPKVTVAAFGAPAPSAAGSRLPAGLALKPLLATPTKLATSQPPGIQLSGMTITPGTVYAGDSFDISATISAPAPPGGISVDLYLGNVAESPIEIPAGAVSGVSRWTAGGDSSCNTWHCIYAGVESTITQPITPSIKNLNISSIRPPAESDFTITVDLTSPAPAGGASVELTSNGDARDPIIIHEGETRGTVDMTSGTFSPTTFKVTYGDSSASLIQTLYLPYCENDDSVYCYDNLDGDNLVSPQTWSDEKQRRIAKQMIDDRNNGLR